jgi:NRPS condensation-like uncharacterized protein
MPAEPQRKCHFTYALHTFDSEQVAALEEYGCDRGVTTFQVLLAAYFLAMAAALPDSDKVLTLLVPVDLRRYLPNPEPFRWCNFTGFENLFLHQDSTSSLDSVVEEIRQQMLQRRGEGTGLASLPVVLDMLPGGLPGSLVPFAIRRQIKRAELRQLRKSRERDLLYGSHGGNLDDDRLRFGNVPVRHAIGCPGEVQNPGAFGFGTTGFGDTLTMFCGSGPIEEMERIVRHMLELLSPALANPLEATDPVV